MIRLDEETAPSPESRRVAWREAVAAVLTKAGRDVSAGQDVEGLLARTTLEGIDIPALVDPAREQRVVGEPGAFPFVRGATTDQRWDVRSFIRESDPIEAARQAEQELAAGATSLWITLGGDGLDPSDLPVMLEPIYLDLAAVVVDARGSVTPAAASAALAAALEGVEVRHAGHHLGVDPYASGAFDDAVVGPTLQRAHALGVRGIVCDATRFANQGAGDALEVALCIAAGIECLRSAERAGIDPGAAAQAMDARLSVSDEQFVSIAKLRAARLLWAAVVTRCGVPTDGAGLRIHAVTAQSMLTRYDPWTNLLRTTIAGFAAAVGGADALTVLPYDLALGHPSSQARRLARNTSTLLLDESHVRVGLDPAGGAYAVEDLTDSIAQTAWSWVQRIEAAGGLGAALTDGSLAAAISQTRGDRDQRIRSRRQPITGVSEFPLADETLLDRRPWEHPDDVHAWAEEFEALRDAPATGVVLLATMGTPAQHTARASFAANLLTAGGMSAVTAGVTHTGDDVARCAQEQGARVAVLCGSDAQYAQDGRAYVQALRGSGVTSVWLAGRPTADLADVIDGHLAAGQDAIDACERLRAALTASDEARSEV